MVKIRKFCAYRALERPYTRKSKYRAKSFIRASPHSKIVRYDMGNKARTEWEYTLHLVSRQDMNIRDNAIEAARQTSNKHFEGKIGADNFHFRIRVYPHHMLRENPLASGAGADRLSTGMQKSFGKVIGICARVLKNRPIFEIKTDKVHIEAAKEGLRKASQKMPLGFKIILIKNEPAKTTKATKTTEAKEEEAVAA